MCVKESSPHNVLGYCGARPRFACRYRGYHYNAQRQDASVLHTESYIWHTYRLDLCPPWVFVQAPVASVVPDPVQHSLVRALWSVHESELQGAGQVGVPTPLPSASVT